MQDVMIDLETMGLTGDSAVVAIGAVEFDAENLGERHYAAIDLVSAHAAGGRIDPATVMWWLQQSDQARQALVRNRQPLGDALREFTAWLTRCGTLGSLRVWGNGANFDPPILEHAYLSAGQEIPWKFYNVRCFRTFRNLFPHIEPDPANGTAHNALDDAVAQAEHYIKIRRTLRARKAG